MGTPWGRFKVILPAVAAALLAIFVSAEPVAGGSLPARSVTELRIEGVINVFTADYIVGGIQQAERDGAGLVVITMDTPGGIDTSMRKIIQAILNTRLPVAVYVSPPGARAASAGLYISQAADIVAMAPGTNIGSAHPVFLNTGSGSSSNTTTDIEGQKVLNDSVAYITALANLHHRNATWAADAVKQSVNVPADEAVKLGVADMVSPDLPHLLAQVNLREVTKHGATIALSTDGAAVTSNHMGFFQGLLHALADPEISYLLMLLAIVGIGFEVTHPGTILPGVVGVTAAILALVSFESLPVSYAGLTLMAFGIILFIVDIKAPTHGVLTVGGVIALGLGGFMFLDQGAPYLEPNLLLAIFPPAIVGLVLAFLISRAIAARRLPPATGPSHLVGKVGEARSQVGADDGSVFVDGALWTARASAPISPGGRVIVTGVKGLTLTVAEAS